MLNIMLINVNMPTTVAQHEKSFITSGPGLWKKSNFYELQFEKMNFSFVYYHMLNGLFSSRNEFVKSA